MNRRQTRTNTREGRTIFVLAVAAVLAAMTVQTVTARDIYIRGADEMLFARGAAGVGVLGQIQVTLTAVTSETSWAWTFCNDGTDEILVKPGAVRGTVLATPAAGLEGTTITMGNVGRIMVGDCIEFGDLKAKTAVLQGETTTQNFSVWGTR